MRNIFSKVIIAGLFVWPICMYAQNETITGFTTIEARNEKQLESRFDQNLNAQNIGAAIKTFSGKPHNIGSPADKEYAQMIESRLKSFGFDTRIETYTVLFPT